MASSVYGTNHALAVKLWAKKLFVEALKETIAAKFIGSTPSSMIQIKDETSKEAGDRIRIGLRMQLSGDGVSGDDTLEDNEEALSTYYDDLLIDQLRHAVRSGGKMSEQRIMFDHRQEALSGLVDWWANRIDTALLNQLGGNTAVTDLRYTGSNATVAPDAAHIIRQGAHANDQSITNADVFDLTLIDVAVEKARTLSPAIRPIRLPEGEFYVMFLHPNQVTDMRISTTAGQWLDITKAAMQGGLIDKNPIFTGALGIYNGVVLHMDSRVPYGVDTAGAPEPETDVRRAIFCGAQAGVIAFGRDYTSTERFKWVEELFDYGNQLGVSAGLVWGAKKTVFNSTDFATIAISTWAEAHTG